MTDDRKMRLLELYEARGDPETFAEAKRLCEQALAGAEASDPETLIAYGYLLECHGRYALRQAVAQYERAIELDVRGDARAATGDPDGPLADWRRAVEVDAENLSPVYSSALLLERLGTARGGRGRVAVRHRLVRLAPGAADGRVAKAGAGAAAGKGPRRLSHSTRALAGLAGARTYSRHRSPCKE